MTNHDLSQRMAAPAKHPLSPATEIITNMKIFAKHGSH